MKPKLFNQKDLPVEYFQKMKWKFIDAADATW